MLTREDDGEEEKMMNCLSIQREGKLWTYIRKRDKENSMPTAKAGAQCRVPVPSPPPRHGGRRGRRGRWGQARPMGAVSHRPHARARQHRTLGKPPGQIPSLHATYILSVKVIGHDSTHSSLSRLSNQIDQDLIRHDLQYVQMSKKSYKL